MEGNTLTIQEWRNVKGDSATIWHTYTYDLDKGADIARYVARHPYAFPGGYEIVAVTDDGGTLCHKCCRTEYRQIRTAYAGDGWNVNGYMVTDSVEECLSCDHCGRIIVDSDEDKAWQRSISQ